MLFFFDDLAWRWIHDEKSWCTMKSILSFLSESLQEAMIGGASFRCHDSALIFFSKDWPPLFHLIVTVFLEGVHHYNAMIKLEVIKRSFIPAQWDNEQSFSHVVKSELLDKQSGQQCGDRWLNTQKQETKNGLIGSCLKNWYRKAVGEFLLDLLA